MRVSQASRQPTPTAPPFVPTLIAIGLVVSMISALGAPLIPRLASELDATLDATQWSLTVTMLVGAVISPLVGRLGDGAHRRRVLIVCLAIVAVGGAVCATATTLPPLIAGRAMQGVGLALMPLTMASAREHLPPVRSGPVIAILSVTTVVGIGIGYPITGLIAEKITIAAAFWVGAVSSAAALALTVLFVPSSDEPSPVGGVDIFGAVLVGGGILAFLLGLEQVAASRWDATTAVFFVAAPLLIVLWVVRSLRTASPLVDLRLMRHPSVVTANVTGLLLGTAMYVGVSLITQVVQLPTGLGETIFVAGLSLLPMSAMSALSPRIARRLAGIAGGRAVVPVGALILASGLLFFALTGSALWHAFVTMGLVGLGVGFTFAAMPAMILGAVPRSDTSSAMSLYQVARYVGFAMGSGLAVTMLRFFSDGAPLPAREAYNAAFAAAAAICVVAAVVAWILPGRVGAQRAG